MPLLIGFLVALFGVCIVVIPLIVKAYKEDKEKGFFDK